MSKIYVVEDECSSRDALLHILKKYFPGHSYRYAENLESARILFDEGMPDLAILDIEYPDGTAFDLIKEMQKREFKVIFVTGYEKYAVQAFKFSAIDFILKPYVEQELVESVNKVLEKPDIPLMNQKFIETLLINYSNQNRTDRQIVLKTFEEIFVVNTRQIVHCLADNNYTTFYLDDNRSIVVSRSMKEFEGMLSDYQFLRVHQSHLVNLMQIKKFDKRDGGALIMSNNAQIPVSTRKRQFLMDYFVSLEKS